MSDTCDSNNNDILPALPSLDTNDDVEITREETADMRKEEKTNV